MSISSQNNFITSYCGKHQLRNNVLVGSSYHNSVFGSVVFVLGLRYQPLEGIKVGLSFSPPSELSLISLEVGVVHNLDQHWVIINTKQSSKNNSEKITISKQRARMSVSKTESTSAVKTRYVSAVKDSGNFFSLNSSQFLEHRPHC